MLHYKMIFKKEDELVDELFAKAPVKKVYFQLALPVVLGMVASMVYNLADTFFVAKTGNTTLVAGVALGTPLFSFMLAIGDIFGLGGSAVISRLLGEKKYALSAKISSFSLYITIAFSLLLTAIMLIFERPILNLLGATPQTYQYAADFYRILVGGSVFIIVSLVPGNIIRTEGLAVKSMIATLSGTILTIILDPLFLFVFDMGAKGIALANVLGYAVNCGILFYYMNRDCKILSLKLRDCQINLHNLKLVLAIGIPASLTNLMQSFGVALLNNHLSKYGASAVAANGIVAKIYMIVILVMVGFAFGAQPLIGYNYGAKNKKRFKEIMRFDFLVEVVYSLVLAVILMVLAPVLVKIFMTDTKIIEQGTYMLRATLLTAPFVGAILVFTTVFQSAGKAWSALIMALARQGVVYAPCMVILANSVGYHGIIWAQPVADAVTFVIGWVLYRKVIKDFSA